MDCVIVFIVNCSSANEITKLRIFYNLDGNKLKKILIVRGLNYKTPESVGGILTRIWTTTILSSETVTGRKRRKIQD